MVACVAGLLSLALIIGVPPKRLAVIQIVRAFHQSIKPGVYFQSEIKVFRSSVLTGKELSSQSSGFDYVASDIATSMVELTRIPLCFHFMIRLKHSFEDGKRPFNCVWLDMNRVD